MREEIVRSIINETDLREQLILLKNTLKEDEQLTDSRLFDKLKFFLESGDSKIRKNAALVLGHYHRYNIKELLLNSYYHETTEYVKEAYLKALARQDCKSITDELRQIRSNLLTDCVTDSKHIDAQLKILNPLILSYITHKKKSIRLLHKGVDVILTSLPFYQFTLFEYVLNLKYKPVAQGVLVRTNSLYDLLPIRNYNELIIPIKNCSAMDINDKYISDCFQNSNLLELLNILFDTEEAFYYKLTDQLKIKNPALISKLVSHFNKSYSKRLLNVTSNYEIEILLRELRPHKVNAYLKITSLDNPRFDYRKEIISNSMQPYVANTLLQLAKPYMDVYAKVLDPFCGSGITLIERCLLKPVSFTIGIDIYAKGLEAAKRNTRAANLDINYVNKDCLRFVNNEMFDEIITDMPTYAQMKDKKALEYLYDNFFKRIPKLVRSDGYVFIYTSEISLIEKNLRLNKGYLSLIEHYDVPRGKNLFYFFILQVR
ncbi:hypothetical protein HMPREF9943_00724 [Eggerthia catenaformis OT 569 = DSM 20559]|uniref:Ribosomal RNA large subunit methyltransferase K/L-like methyltransferase domain-containing protein n=1 Tax=Eggerthia catenaformis OT 569 = DSM 20559 TaxID=999415 RepID=M2Q3W1_9FIRM|nr:methyltransferase [Eggerthia catenaformis]EMD16946.1 hypothetical protein HMPREF9943_00724 [Eggerthia catenaformis OT 569 = DSM 20559]